MRGFDILLKPVLYSTVYPPLGYRKEPMSQPPLNNFNRLVTWLNHKGSHLPIPTRRQLLYLAKQHERALRSKRKRRRPAKPRKSRGVRPDCPVVLFGQRKTWGGPLPPNMGLFRRAQHKAHLETHRAMQQGRLPRLTGSTICVDCGVSASMYDHRDYSKPLEVAPVCARCNARRGHAIVS